MIRIGEIICGLQNGGVESMLYNYLSNIDMNEFQVEIITYDKSNEKTRQKFENIGCKIIEITPKRKNLLKSLTELYKCLKNGKYDVIHSHMSINNSIPLIFAKKLKIPNRISHSHQAKRTKNIIKKMYEKVNKFIIAKCANQYIACGEEAATYLYGRNSKAIILKNAIDLEKYQYSNEVRKKIRDEYGIKDGDILLGHVGRFTYQKNHDFLIELLKTINDKKYKMILIGDGELKPEIIKNARAYNLENSIIFLENITNVNEFLSAMDIFLLPSHFEGLPLVGIEAQANGIKCLFSSNIDSKIKINENVEMLDLNIKEWAQNCNEANRVMSQESLVNNGYDIRQQAIKLSNIYYRGMK